MAPLSAIHTTFPSSQPSTWWSHDRTLRLSCCPFCTLAVVVLQYLGKNITPILCTDVKIDQVAASFLLLFDSSLFIFLPAWWLGDPCESRFQNFVEFKPNEVAQNSPKTLWVCSTGLSDPYAQYRNGHCQPHNQASIGHFELQGNHAAPTRRAPWTNRYNLPGGGAWMGYWSWIIYAIEALYQCQFVLLPLPAMQRGVKG